MNSTLQKLREKNLCETKEAIKKSVHLDTLIIQAANSVDTLQKILNTLTEKLREWYNLYNPEFSHATRDNKEFAGETAIKNRDELLQKIEKKEVNSMGGSLQKEDIVALKNLSKTANVLFESINQTEKYVEDSLQKVCPNMLIIAGPAITSKLLMIAGSLKRLAEMPASTLQLLGAEKALLRHIKQGAKSPKFGLLYGHTFIQRAKKQNKGKSARILANKLSIAAKVDFFNGKFVGDALKKELEAKLK